MSRRPPHRATAIALAAVAVAASSCSLLREQPMAAPVSLVADHYAGTVLSGPQPAASLAEDEWAAAWIAQFDMRYVRELPVSGTPVSADARLALVESGDQPFRTRSELATNIRRAELPTIEAADAGASAGETTETLWSERRRGALPPGTTVVFRARTPSDDVGGPRPSWETLDLELSRRRAAPHRLELALGLEGWVVPRSEEIELEPGRPSPAQPPRRQHERLILTRAPTAGGAPVRLFVPAPVRHARRGGFVVELSVRPEDEAVTAEALSYARERVGVALASARSGDPTQRADFRESRTALDALARRRLQRPALVFLAEGTGARVAGEMALSSDTETLADWATSVRAELAADAQAPPLHAAELGWFLERSAFAWLIGLASADDPMPPELAALLLRHTGELARFPDLLVTALERSTGIDDFNERLVQENVIFLEDGRPLARVRAFDWLEARGAAPADFDPLAPLGERRAALARAQAEREAALAEANQ